MAKPWRCWCGQRYKTGYDGHYAREHRAWHERHGDTLPPNPLGSKLKETRSWTTVRDIVLQRDKHRCRACGRLEKLIHKVTKYPNIPRADGLQQPYEYHWTKSNLEVHHIISRKMGGTDHPTNLITLCLKCHYRTKHGSYSGNPAQRPPITLDSFEGGKQVEATN